MKSQKRHDNPYQRRQQWQQRKQRRSSNSENQKTNNQESFRGQSARFKEAHQQLNKGIGIISKEYRDKQAQTDYN